MRFLCALLLSCTAFAFAQTDSKPAAGASSTQTIQTAAQIVVVDVSVMDTGGKHVRHMKASDFTVLENGVPQAVDHFEEHITPETTALPNLPRLEPGTYTNFSFTPEDGPLNVLVVDTLNTPIQDQVSARQKILAFLSTLKTTQRMAIFGLSSRLYLLQGFTSDPAVLHAALAGKAGNARTSPILAAPVGSDSMSDTMSEKLGVAPVGDQGLGNAPGSQQVSAYLKEFEATVSADETRDRVLLTLTAFNQLARYLASLPGRKNLIWVSGSFPINILPNGSSSNPFKAFNSMEDEFRQTTSLLARAQVSVFPIDARGLFPAAPFDASVSGSKYVRRPTSMSSDLQKSFQNTADERITMNAMADDTGGKAFVDNNDIGGAVDDALKQGSAYYTLVYKPSNRKWDGQYRKIVVRTAAGNNLTLNYRHGYYADNLQPKTTDAVSIANATGQKIDPMLGAMQYGAPNPTELLFKAKIVPSADVTSALAEDNIAGPKVKPPYRTFTLYLAASAPDITFRPMPDGNRASALRFTTIVYNRDGQTINLLDHSTRATIPQADYQAMLKSGVPYTEQISVPTKGDYFLRIGIQDLFTGKVGSVEVFAAGTR